MRNFSSFSVAFASRLVGNIHPCSQPHTRYSHVAPAMRTGQYGTRVFFQQVVRSLPCENSQYLCRLNKTCVECIASLRDKRFCGVREQINGRPLNGYSSWVKGRILRLKGIGSLRRVIHLLRGVRHADKHKFGHKIRLNSGFIPKPFIRLRRRSRLRWITRHLNSESGDSCQLRHISTWVQPTLRWTIIPFTRGQMR